MTSQEVALRDATKSAVVQFQDREFAQQVALAVPEGVSPRKLLRAAATAVLDNPLLAREDLRPALIRATLKSAQDGLLPDGREAALVIFEGRNPTIAYMPMIGGFRKIAAEFGWSLFAALVHENDQFDPDYDTHRANFKPARLGTERGPILGAFANAEHKDGRRALEVMTVAEIEKVRAVSRAKGSGPWVDWWGEMAKKTVARRLFKSLPLDPKDRERADRVLSAELTSEQAIEALYGDSSGERAASHSGARGHARPVPEGGPDAQAPGMGARTPEPTPEEADWHPVDVPFEGQEPGDEPEPVEEPKFTAGKHQGRTPTEVLTDGDKGRSYLEWAANTWKDEAIREACQNALARADA